MNETKEIDLPCGCAVERETRPVVRYVAWCEEHFGRREGLRILTPENQAVVDAAAPLAAERGERDAVSSCPCGAPAGHAEDCRQPMTMISVAELAALRARPALPADVQAEVERYKAMWEQAEEGCGRYAAEVKRLRAKAEIVDAMAKFLRAEAVPESALVSAPFAHRAWLEGKASFIAKMRLAFPVLLAAATREGADA